MSSGTRTAKHAARGSCRPYRGVDGEAVQAGQVDAHRSEAGVGRLYHCPRQGRSGHGGCPGTAAPCHTREAVCAPCQRRPRVLVEQGEREAVSLAEKRFAHALEVIEREPLSCTTMSSYDAYPSGGRPPSCARAPEVQVVHGDPARDRRQCRASPPCGILLVHDHGGKPPVGDQRPSSFRIAVASMLAMLSVRGATSRARYSNVRYLRK